MMQQLIVEDSVMASISLVEIIDYLNPQAPRNITYHSCPTPESIKIITEAMGKRILYIYFTMCAGGGGSCLATKVFIGICWLQEGCRPVMNGGQLVPTNPLLGVC